MNAGQILRAGGIDSIRVRLLIHPIEPETVRVRPAPRLLQRFWARDIRAMTLGRTIFLEPLLLSSAQDRAGLLLVHELVHVRQWHELGVMRFLWRYLSAYLRGRWDRLGHRAAYLAIPLEVEARQTAALLE
ncbi:MAG: eCIS core domain-containing protein [Acidimicrobiia bacterium]